MKKDVRKRMKGIIKACAIVFCALVTALENQFGICLEDLL